MKSIRINDTNEIRVSKEIYRGRTVMDLRKFFRPDRDSEWKATSKGITFDVSRSRDVIESMEAELAVELAPAQEVVDA